MEQDQSMSSEVDNLHDALKSVGDVAFLRSQIIQDLERKIAAIEAERELWKTRAFEAERKQDAVTHDLFAARAQNDLECRNHRTVVREYQQAREVDAAAYNEMKVSRDKLERDLKNAYKNYDGARIQLRGCQADLESTIAERNKLSDELAEARKHNATLAEYNVKMSEHATKLSIKYDATARERDELLARLELPTAPGRVVYVTQAGARAFTQSFSGTPAPSTPEVTLHDMTVHAGAKFSCGEFHFILRNDVRVRHGVNESDLILDPVEVQS